MVQIFGGTFVKSCTGDPKCWTECWVTLYLKRCIRLFDYNIGLNGVHDQILFLKGIWFSETNNNICMRSTHRGMQVRSVQQKSGRLYFSNLIVLDNIAHGIINLPIAARPL